MDIDPDFDFVSPQDEFEVLLKCLENLVEEEEEEDPDCAPLLGGAGVIPEGKNKYWHIACWKEQKHKSAFTQFGVVEVNLHNHFKACFASCVVCQQNVYTIHSPHSCDECLNGA